MGRMAFIENTRSMQLVPACRRDLRRSGRLLVVVWFVFLAGIATQCRADAGTASNPNQETGQDAQQSDIVDLIDRHVRQAWLDNEVSPSPVASDAEWLRRVYLDVVGHIPPADEVEPFLRDRDKNKRSETIDRLLDDPGYVRNWTTIWTNLTIGRQPQEGVSRSAMQDFFSTAFTENRPWREIVFDLVSAEGHYEQNGAVNYLLAQMSMRDDGVQATAKTARLFLGKQVQCMQCHNHPHPQHGGKQDEFWQLNSFFRQARRIDHRSYDADAGRRVDDYTELVLQDYSGPVFFEKRNGEMQVAYPNFSGTEVDDGPSTNRRLELAKLMTDEENPLIARAMVNRMWGHFFGYGFTRPIDDMGPHNPPTHPDLLERLTEEFVRHNYDVKQLIRWICSSEAYHLTSRFGRGNEIDDPASGEMPLFSHMYVKSMEAEQLFDSLIVATEAHQSARASWSASEKQREEWLQQFVIAFETDENDETTTFNATIPQALMMMNGPLIENAISAREGSYLHRVLSRSTSDAIKVQQLFLSTLSRRPSRRELTAANKLIRSSSDKFAAYQDLFWALLNSNEFIFNH